MAMQLNINNVSHSVDVAPDTPLLYVLTNEIGLKGARFGCGLAQCGSCSVLVDGAEVRSCVTAVSDLVGSAITTLEGLPALYARQKGLTAPPAMHPLQEAFVAEQAPQCGYCYNGMTIKGAELLARNPSPSDTDIREAMSGHICRCGTYPRIIAAIRRAAADIGRAQ
jgi:aerobic-type carbon monoxide dehydrogenase small subunit (CoxS/CutS family)